MPHQNLGLVIAARVLSDSGQHCVELSPSKIVLWMGPKLYRVTIFFGYDVLRLATEDYMLFGYRTLAQDASPEN